MASFFKIKTLLYCLVAFLGIIRLQAQKHPVFYGGLEYYRHRGYENNAFLNFNMGAQVYQWKFFTPEIGVDYYGGFPDDQRFENPNPGFVGQYILKKEFDALLFSVAPKLRFGEEPVYLTFAPKYHVGKVYASADYFVEEGGRYLRKIQKNAANTLSFWSFSLGVDSFLVRTDTYWLALTLNYTLLDVAGVFEKLDFSEYNIPVTYSNTHSIGLGLRFYWDVFYKE